MQRCHVGIEQAVRSRSHFESGWRLRAMAKMCASVRICAPPPRGAKSANEDMFCVVGDGRKPDSAT